MPTDNDTQPCWHPVGHIQQDQEGTAFCVSCELQQAQDKIEYLRAWIIEAASAWNLDGSKATDLIECAGLVRMCHEGRQALDENARLHKEIDDLRMTVAVQEVAIRRHMADWKDPLQLRARLNTILRDLEIETGQGGGND